MAKLPNNKQMNQSRLFIVIGFVISIFFQFILPQFYTLHFIGLILMAVGLGRMIAYTVKNKG